jgi:hypothetical protein
MIICTDIFCRKIDDPEFYTYNGEHSKAYPIFGAIGGYNGERPPDLAAIEEFCA